MGRSGPVLHQASLPTYPSLFQYRRRRRFPILADKDTQIRARKHGGVWGRLRSYRSGDTSARAQTNQHRSQPSLITTPPARHLYAIELPYPAQLSPIYPENKVLLPVMPFQRSCSACCCRGPPSTTHLPPCSAYPLFTDFAVDAPPGAASRHDAAP